MGDDQPYVIQGGQGDLVELPSHWGLDDWPPYVHMMDIDYRMQVRAPSEAIAAFRDEFDAAWEYGGLWVAVWHPFVTGRLARLKAVEGLIRYMRDKGGVWFARMEDIAAHLRAVSQRGRYRPRRERLPYYPGPLDLETAAE